MDWYRKKIIGYYAGMQCQNKPYLEALDAAVNREFACGMWEQRLFLMSDNGSRPTSMSFTKSCRDTDITQWFTRHKNPRGNADTERAFRTMKEWLLWLRDWLSPFELADVLSKWIE